MIGVRISLFTQPVHAVKPAIGIVDGAIVEPAVRELVAHPLELKSICTEVLGVIIAKYLIPVGADIDDAQRKKDIYLDDVVVIGIAIPKILPLFGLKDGFDAFAPPAVLAIGLNELSYHELDKHRVQDVEPVAHTVPVAPHVPSPPPLLASTC